MKSLVQYIKESEEEDKKVTKVNNLKVIYTAKANPFILACPDSYNEDDMQAYLDDACLEQMPASAEICKRLFGENKSSITDAYFKYSRYDIVKDGINHVNLEWDPRLNTKETPDASIVYYKIYDLEYIIEFSSFNILNIKEDEINKSLWDIFKVSQSSLNNKYPVEIELKEENIKYE